MNDAPKIWSRKIRRRSTLSNHAFTAADTERFPDELTLSDSFVEECEFAMLKWAFTFLVLGLIAGLLGFVGIAGVSIAIAKILFFIFMVIFLVLIVAGVTLTRRSG